jgi:hypothetical protein
VQLPDVVDDAWKGVNKAKYVWDKDPFLSKIGRLGMKTEMSHQLLSLGKAFDYDVL